MLKQLNSIAECIRIALSIDMDRSFIARMYRLGPRVALNFDQMMYALPPIDGVIGRANLWIAEDFGCCASG